MERVTPFRGGGQVFRTILMSFVFAASVAGLRAQCFSPLSDPQSNKTSNWKDLVDFLPADVKADGVKAIQTIAAAYGDKINLDFYAITFKKPSGRALDAIFKDLRMRFATFAHHGPTLYSEASQTYFLAYRGSSSSNDALQMHNNKLWQSSNPKGAVMSFVLAHYAPALIVPATLTGVRVVQEQGDVLVTCASSTDFIFSTVTTVKDGYHPVSGNRGFGLRDNGNGTLTFYTKGADRECRMESGLEYGGNVLLRRGVKSPEIEGSPTKQNPDAVFEAGHNFWLEFFGNLIDYLDNSGMTANSAAFIKNTHRYDYPLH